MNCKVLDEAEQRERGGRAQEQHRRAGMATILGLCSYAHNDRMKISVCVCVHACMRVLRQGTITGRTLSPGLLLDIHRLKFWIVGLFVPSGVPKHSNSH